MTDYHPVVSKIIELLDHHHFWYQTFEHQPVRTSQEAATIRTGYTLHQGTKAMIARIKISNTNKKFVMLVFPADLNFDTKKIKQIFGAKDIRLATEQELSQLTNGIEPGGVPPFGTLFSLEVYADPTVLGNEKIIFNAGDRRFSIAINSTDYQNLVNPTVTSIT